MRGELSEDKCAVMVSRNAPIHTHYALLRLTSFGDVSQELAHSLNWHFVMNTLLAVYVTLCTVMYSDHCLCHTPGRSPGFYRLDYDRIVLELSSAL